MTCHCDHVQFIDFFSTKFVSKNLHNPFQVNIINIPPWRFLRTHPKASLNRRRFKREISNIASRCPFARYYLFNSMRSQRLCSNKSCARRKAGSQQPQPLTIEQMRSKVKSEHNSKQHKCQTCCEATTMNMLNIRNVTFIGNAVMQALSLFCWFHASQFSKTLAIRSQCAWLRRLINIQ